MSQHDEAAANGEAQDIGAPKIPLKQARGAARIKKPPFGMAPRTPGPAVTGDAEVQVQQFAQEGAFARWWRETGSVVAGGLILTWLWSLAFAIYISASI